jgi:hypothetical protein
MPPRDLMRKSAELVARVVEWDPELNIEDEVVRELVKTAIPATQIRACP